MQLMRKNSNKIKMPVGRQIFTVFNILLMVALCTLFIAPYLHIFAQALNTADRQGLGLFPVDFSWASMSAILQYDGIVSAFIMTVVRVIVGSMWAIIIQYAAAYAFSYKRLWGKKFLIWFYAIPMFVQPGVIANMLIFKELQLVDTFFIMVLPLAFSFYNMTVMRIYVESISDSFKEAARIDGASEITIMFKIYMPLSIPILATVFIWTAVMYWNDWTTNLYYASAPDSERLYTLQYVMQRLITDPKYAEAIEEAGNLTAGTALIKELDAVSIKAAGLIIGSLPMIVAYPFLQKFFAKGISIGGVKE